MRNIFNKQSLSDLLSRKKYYESLKNDQYSNFNKIFSINNYITKNYTEKKNFKQEKPYIEADKKVNNIEVINNNDNSKHITIENQSPRDNAGRLPVPYRDRNFYDIFDAHLNYSNHSSDSDSDSSSDAGVNNANEIIYIEQLIDSAEDSATESAASADEAESNSDQAKG